MLEKILNTLCCPLCKSELILKAFVEESRDLSLDKTAPSLSKEIVAKSSHRKIKEGVLLCSQCKVYYPIYSYVPVMLVFETDFHRKFIKENVQQLNLIPDYKIPNGSPYPGEKSVQETFSDQWHMVEESELSFAYTSEELKLLNQKVWLRWLEHSRENVKNILNAGCGMGREAVALQEVSNLAEIYAIDLNFSLFKGAELFKEHQGINFIIASLFNLPFKPSAFDLVYSQGVIHHTFSTYEAFKSIATYVRKEGYLFIWVYALEDHLVRRGIVGIILRLMYLVESIVRPIISRSPKFLRDIIFGILTLIFYPIDKVVMLNSEKWELKNTNHALRDWLSPRYAFRHSYNEVLEWFEDMDFKIIDIQSPRNYRQLFNKRLWGIGLTGNKVKDKGETESSCKI